MNPFDIVKGFEDALVKYTEAPYAVAIESCSNALLLMCEYLKVDVVEIPKKTYISVPQAIIRSGGKIRWTEEEWSGAYQMKPYPLVDSARQFYRGMYKKYPKGSYVCISFHGKKHLNIGRGGAVLCDNPEAVRWLKMARFDGRHEGVATINENLEIIGHHCYMTPELAAHGLMMLSFAKDHYPDLTDNDPDLSLQKIYKKYTVE